jgi:hypothetical protein
MSTLPRELVKSHRRELSYIVGRFTTEHLIRLYAQFDGDFAAAVVLGTIERFHAAATDFQRQVNRRRASPAVRR